MKYKIINLLMLLKQIPSNLEKQIIIFIIVVKFEAEIVDVDLHKENIYVL
jgi:hypothetical protein